MAKADSTRNAELIFSQLRKCFRVIDSVRLVWNEMRPSVLVLINSLTNVSEQYHCTLRISQSHSCKSELLRKFPGIDDRIGYKLIQEMELLVWKIKEHLQEIQTLSTKIHQQYVTALSAYRKSCKCLALQEVTQGSATWPSVAAMLEWIGDLDIIFQYLYENQRQVCESLDYSKEDLMQSLPSRWKSGEREAKESLENVLVHVSFFMADG